MPIYEYQCNSCEHTFEEWQKMSDPRVETCPSCGKNEVERLVSATAFHLKGGGWYADGYGSSGSPGKSSGASASKSESKDSSSGSSSGASSSSESSSTSSSSSSSSD
jgi:putative FmdB family regulatory protein